MIYSHSKLYNNVKNAVILMVSQQQLSDYLATSLTFNLLLYGCV